jgi:tRNA threonylcarbamoyladenosine biosynthesis protein TsaE
VGSRAVTLEELAAEAAHVWATAPRGGVVWLSGDLGTGKTTFVQALGRAAGAAPARSPTYALVHEYPSPEGVIVHVDCYRLKHPDEAVDLDFRVLERRARLLLIEWPERAGRHAPAPDVRITLAHAASPDRRLLERSP